MNEISAGAVIGVWLGHSTSFQSAAPALAMIGVTASYRGVLGLNWIQERIPPTLAGRILGIVMFAVLGLTPLSMSLGGFIIARSSLTTLLTASGCLIAALALIGLLVPAINRFGLFPAPPVRPASAAA